VIRWFGPDDWMVVDELDTEEEARRFHQERSTDNPDRDYRIRYVKAIDVTSDKGDKS